MYSLGIDLGTTFTAAATWREGRVEIASLGSRAAVIPSVVLLREDETILTGESAHRRGVTEPHRVSREFKRRLGDTTPILLGGAPYSADALMGRLLRSTIDQVSEQQGSAPQRICVSHPANWGPYKKDLLTQAARLANIDQPVTFTTEPEAAAVFYAHQQRLEPGAVVAVYDLGGGTFDAAVFNHVRQALDGKLEELDEDDPAALAAVTRLREECVAAKEALSSDTDTAIPVLLPNISTEIRLTRAELEAMVRPTLYSTIEALQRALRSAGVTAEQLHSVLLVGGSSRMPLVAQLVGSELGRPVAVDAHPKHAVALGAAWLASGVPPDAAAPAGAIAPGPAGPDGAPVGTTAVAATATAAMGAMAVGAGAGATATGAVAAPAPDPGAGAPPAPVPVAGQAPVPSPSSPSSPPTGQAPVPPPGQPPMPPQPTSGRRRGLPVLIGGAVLALLLVGGGLTAWILADRDSDPDSGKNVALEEDPGVTDPAPDDTDQQSVADPTPGQDDSGDGDGDGGGDGPGEPPATTEPALPPDEQCTDAIRANPRWVCLTSAVMQDGQLIIEYEAEWAGSIPDINGGYHLHVYGGDGTNPADEVMGTQAAQDRRGSWKIRDEHPAVLDADAVAQVIGDQPKVCARIAAGNHELVPAVDGGYTTGNCVPIQR